MKSLAEAADKAEILRRLRDVGPDNARRWGRMTAHQMVCHLSDTFLCVMGRLPVSAATGPFQRTVVKWIALYVPVRWRPGIRTRPEIDQCLGRGTKPAEFATDMAQLQGLVELFTAPSREFEWQPHPVFGPLSDREWLRWGYLHMDHHLRQFGA